MSFQLESQEQENKKQSLARWPLGKQLGWTLGYFKIYIFGEKDSTCDIKKKIGPDLFNIMHKLKNSACSSKSDDQKTVRSQGRLDMFLNLQIIFDRL